MLKSSTDTQRHLDGLTGTLRGSANANTKSCTWDGINTWNSTGWGSTNWLGRSSSSADLYVVVTVEQ